jgi:hypothetical protein
MIKVSVDIIDNHNVAAPAGQVNTDLKAAH